MITHDASFYTLLYCVYNAVKDATQSVDGAAAVAVILALPVATSQQVSLCDKSIFAYLV